jgi:hypothetical protein
MHRKAPVKSTMWPGQKGTARLSRQCDDQLLCVHYCYDAQRGKRMSTVELIVDEQDRVPGFLYKPERRMFVHMHPQKRACHLPFGKVLELWLEKRIIGEELDIWLAGLEIRHPDSRSTTGMETPSNYWLAPGG